MKHQNILRIALLALFIPFLLGTATAQKKIRLQYNLKKGTMYTYDLSMDQEISFTANGQDMTLNQEMTMALSSTVDNGEQPDTYKITSTIDGITMKQSIFGMEIFYDSGDSSTFTSGMGQKLGEELNKLIGKDYSITIDKQGNLKEMDMKNLNANSDIQDNLNQSSTFAAFPDHKVAVGETWEVKTVPLTDSSLIINTKYTLKKIKGKKAFIDFESTITSAESNESKISGTQKGELIIDKKTGWTNHATIDQELKMEMNNNGMTFPATISGTTEVTSKKK